MTMLMMMMKTTTFLIPTNNLSLLHLPIQKPISCVTCSNLDLSVLISLTS
uniref:Uncharacterized protein n=1 Tax=Medicago truncatula TaxID=3880 RepID=I3SG00_MEDTR|nr:unknown [Medicago truncatula]